MAKGDQEKYGNNMERNVFGADESVEKQNASITARYKYAARHVHPGQKVLEFGCSSGFALQFLPGGIHYTGVDHDPQIIEFAKKNYPAGTFTEGKIEDFLRATVGNWDAIIAFEVLEHLPNGREVAQMLKERCNTLLISTPHDETPGFWGPHHVLHHLTRHDFPGFEYRYVYMNGDIGSFPTPGQPTLMLMHWERGHVYPAMRKVLCEVCTRDRWEDLAICLTAVAFQTHPPDKVQIFDDGNHQDMRQHPRLGRALQLLSMKGVPWEVTFTPGRGQYVGHEMANTAGFDLVWRLDDDNVPEPDVLERLLCHFHDPSVGAVAGAVFEIDRPWPGGTGKIVDAFHLPNIQWAPGQGTREVEHCYGSFLYKAGVAHYRTYMSPACFHEEDILTHRIHRAGYRLIADTSILTYHWKAPGGGTRATDLQWGYEFDQTEYMKLVESEWGLKIVHLDVGIGDHYAFKQCLPRLLEKYKHVIVGCCYPEVLQNIPRVHIIWLGSAKMHTQNQNVYSWMLERNWTGSLADAYATMLGVA